MPAYESTEEFLNSTQLGRQVIRIRENVSAALTAIGNKGVTVPSGSNSDDLATLIASIQTGGGTPSQAQHSILFEFSDSTSATITAYWDGTFISDAIRATVPTTYDNKVVQQASLDGVAWYIKPTYTFETIYSNDVGFNADPGNYPYCWITSLADVEIPVGSIWRVTFDGAESIITVTYSDAQHGGVLGNPKYGINGNDDGSGLTYGFYHTPWGAWSGSADVQDDTAHNVKIERATTG